MSACIEVRQNRSGTWTAAGRYDGIYAEVTAPTRHGAVARVGGALNFKNWPSIVEDYRKALHDMVENYEYEASSENAALLAAKALLGDPS
jgi:hypothetical protein